MQLIVSKLKNSKKIALMSEIIIDQYQYNVKQYTIIIHILHNHMLQYIYLRQYNTLIAMQK